jgi:hypothetical protein
MNNPEREQQKSPELLIEQIVGLELAEYEDKGLHGEAQQRLNTKKGTLRKELYSMMSQEQAQDMINAAKARIKEDENEAMKDLRIGTEPDEYKKAA